MPRAIFYVFVSLLLVVSCECKDMHWRKLPEEKDIAFKGEVKTPPKSVYRKGESRDIQVHLASNDEEAQDAQFKILSATLADGSPADVDYDSLKLGYNTLSYTPKGPGTHEITLRVAVEGEGNVQTIPCTLEAPAAKWQVGGHADAAGNIALTITNAPEEWRSESWRITNTTFSEGLAGRLEPTPTELHYGENQFRINLDLAVLTEPHVRLEIQGPDEITKTCQIDLTRLCVAQLSNTMNEEENALAERLANVNQYIQETEASYQLPPETVTDPRANRERQDAVGVLLGRLEAFQTQYEQDIQAFSGNLTVLEQTQVNENLAVFEANNKRLKDAIASLKSAQVQLQQQCTTAHEALFKTMTNRNQEASILLYDPRLDVNEPNERGYSLLHLATRTNNIESIRKLIEKNININAGDGQGKTALHHAAAFGNINAVLTLLNSSNISVNREDEVLNYTALDWAVWYRQGHIVETLLNNGRITLTKKTHALHLAAEEGHSEIVNTLLDNGADVNAKGIDGFTALMYASKNGHEEIVNTLLEREANVNETNGEKEKPFGGNTALHLAAENGHDTIINALLNRESIEPCPKNNDGRTPLFLAVQYNRENVVKVFLTKKETNVQSKDKYGYTLLRFARDNNNNRITDLLKKAGAH